VQCDPEFRKALLREGLEAMLSGEIVLAKAIFRDYINATIGFTGLAEASRIPPKSLMRMYSPAGNPRAANLLEIVKFLQAREGVRFLLKPTSSYQKIERREASKSRVFGSLKKFLVLRRR
jgi:DNA-binding phage protein